MNIFVNLKVMTFKDILDLKLGKLTYKYSNNLLPKHFNSYFEKNADFHNYNTRHAENFMTSIHRISLYEQSIRFRGPHLWNRLSKTIKQSSSLNVFKKKLIEYLKIK